MRQYEAKIPKMIHYCWFGRKEKPELVRRCMATWRERLPDYDIVEWNELTFDVESVPYVKEAYEAGKFAFVSDYVRVYALHRFGGVYLDTDVEVFRPFDDLLHHESFWGFEQGNFVATSTIGSARHNPLIQRFLQSYENRSFLNADGSFDQWTNVAAVTRLLTTIGLKPDGTYQELEGVGAFYPQTYFSPYDYINCRSFRTERTYTLHHYYKSWLPLEARVKGRLKKALSGLIGGDNLARLRAAVRK